MSYHDEFEIKRQFPQPIDEISNASAPFKMNEVIAVGRGGAHEIGHVNTCVLHRLAVPVAKEVFFGLTASRTIGLALSRFQ